MPVYEYVSEEDGETITLLRSVHDADKPVEDPGRLGRSFKRQLSTFQVGASSKPQPDPPFAGGCPCGNPNGPCDN